MVEPVICLRSGSAGYRVPLMLKATFLEIYYDLPDRELESELQDRVSFGVFCEMYDSSDFPDHSPFCDFRNDLVKANMLEAVFDDITAQLEVQDLKIKGICIVNIDATIMQSAVRPMKKRTESEVQKVRSDGEEQHD